MWLASIPMVGRLLTAVPPNERAVRAMLRRIGLRQVASRKLVSQPAPSVRPYATWSSFPVVEVGWVVSSAMEASLR
jgi:hypothetical protein